MNSQTLSMMKVKLGWRNRSVDSCASDQIRKVSNSRGASFI